jgi:hydrophobe/amphiphile efflux-1 (HAE1) family protein
MRLSDVSIRNPVFAWMLMAAFIIFGAISFSRLGVSQMPDVDFPVLTVSISLSGAAPEVMETTVVDPLEDALMAVEGIRSVSSSSKSGSATVTIEFELGRNIDVALQDVQARVAQAQRRLPKNVDPPSISKTNPEDQPIMWLALTYDKNDPIFLMKYARDYLKDRFSTVAGVGDISLGGFTEPQLRVWAKANLLKQNNLTVTDLIDAIQTGHIEQPGGFVEKSSRNFSVRTLGEAQSVEEFRNLVISKRAGQNIQDSSQAIRLGEVADVEEGLAEITRISRFNGVSSIGLGIRKQRGTNAVEVSRAVKAKIKEVSSQLPPGMSLAINFDSTKFIEDSVSELNKHLVLAVILTSMVCWMFLGSWTATLNVLLSIPTSIMGAFIGLYFFGFTLNVFTMLGLTLAIGVVVDDAIMVLENIFRYNEKGRGPIESAIIGAREISFAAMAASVAVLAIFLPVAFMKGVIGKFFLQFGMTISLAVILSLIESLTITPMRCASFVHTGARTTRLGRGFEKSLVALRKFYQWSLALSLNHPWRILLASLVFVAASFFSVKYLRNEFTPSQDQSLFIARLMLPAGSSLSYTNEKVLKVEEWLRGRSEVQQVYANVGGFGSGASDVNTAMLFITMKPKGERGLDPITHKELSQSEFMDVARKGMAKIESVRPVLMDLSQRGLTSGRGYPIEFTIMGSDWDQLAKQSERLKKEMDSSGLMSDIDSDYRLGMPEIQLKPDRVQAGLHGVSIATIGQTVNALIGGVVVGQYPKGGHRYDIQVRMEKSEDSLAQIKNLMVGNSRNNLIPLSKVVEQETKPSLQSIFRLNRQRAVTITANLKAGVSQPIAMEWIKTRASQVLEPGFMLTEGGSSKAFGESKQSLFLALVLGFIVAYMILASQFNSFIDPLTVLMALPFSFSGAFFALLLTNQSLNIYSMIGFLLLMGIVKKNSILLIEFTNTVRDRGGLTDRGDAAVDGLVIDARRALIEACPVRLRPILMTSFATVASAIPSATAFGAGAESMRPMAITLIGGVVVSTALTLYVVPCFYLLMDRLRKRDLVREETKKAFSLVGDEGL